MIISASRRTDIPAFYGNWFMERIRAGYCVTVNPFNPRQVYKVSLQSEDVDVIVFWTKNPEPLLEHLHELQERGYCYLFQYTLNHYPQEIEPNLSSWQERVKSFLYLSDKLGSKKVIWRYDPILFYQNMGFEYHLQAFSRLSSLLRGKTERVMISFYNDYRAATRRLKKAGLQPDIEPEKKPGWLDFLKELSEIAGENDLQIFSCAEKRDLSPAGIKEGRCIDSEYLADAFQIEVKAIKDKNQRRECGCVVSKDIGAYGTCAHHCIYCYGWRNKKEVSNNMERHHIDSLSLTEYQR